MHPTAIVLLNLGGPASLDEVQPFLLNLFQDREIIKLGPAFLQPLIARLIVASRLLEVRTRYASIGGRSPILPETQAQAVALAQALAETGHPMEVRPVFRYSPPRAGGVLRELAGLGIRRILPVTLYPHACNATTGSSMGELKREAADLELEILPGVQSYATDPGYLDALEALLRTTLAQAPGATVVFSAHSLPLKQIQGGDPYERETQATVEALKARLGDIPGGYRLAYQSKVGPVAWLEPSLGSVLKELGGREVVVMPISFVGEHIETLFELDIEYRELAGKCGVTRFLRVPALGTDPTFIGALAHLALQGLS
ncbi:ferrochelatase [Holophaga foetida]|uniref:ferrochelatase n=1 Tax=Holophaga foetida TaxID=35839 RepID=UPI000247373C|nr:ferrochelatase [Holophaga foetida]